MTLNLLPLKMSGKIHNYEAWEERIISEVRVEYYLRSLSGNSLLVAVGYEIRKGHMAYAVATEYFKAFGSNATIIGYTQWTKRRDVVNWVKSLVRNNDSPSSKLDLDLVPKHQGDGWSLDEEEKLTLEDPTKRSSKKLGSNSVHQKQDSGLLDATNLVLPKEATRSELTTLKFNTDLSSIEATGIKALEPKPHQTASFQVGEKIEVLCQDSGMRGCWFTCKIVKVSEYSFEVQYNDAHNVEASVKLEEWVPASRLADPDKLGLRHSGRLTVRPCPPKDPCQFFEVGASVESWWKNSWWESFVLTCASLSSNDSYHVFLPGERKFLTLHRKDLRVAKDWIDNTWVAVKPHPDILSYICLVL